MSKPSAAEFPSLGDAMPPRRFAISDIADALRLGWRTFRSAPAASMAFASLFTLIGLILLAMVGHLGLSPMALPFAGGFMLVGPALLTGFFRLATISAQGPRPGILDAFAAFVHAPAGLWMVALVCSFLFLIWITDAAVLYAFMIGAEHLPYDLPWLIRIERHIISFELWGALMGSVLALIIFAISAFSVPLLHEGRANPVQAIHASVRAVFGSFPASIAWGVVLTGTTLLSILVLPLLLVTLPVLAYASFALYRSVFPTAEDARSR
jgi:uncharacterized membrane protein